MVLILLRLVNANVIVATRE